MNRPFKFNGIYHLDTYAIIHQYTKLNLLVAQTNFLLRDPDAITSLTREQKETLINEIQSSKEFMESDEEILIESPTIKKEILENFNTLINILKEKL